MVGLWSPFSSQAISHSHCMDFSSPCGPQPVPHSGEDMITVSLMLDGKQYRGQRKGTGEFVDFVPTSKSD